MKGLGKVMIAFGAAVGGAVAVAMFAHVGIAGAPWLVNVALAKLGLVASGGLMAGGAVTVRLAKRFERPALDRLTK
jgi:hypothetical protein